jgi:hypothetical protein
MSENGNQGQRSISVSDELFERLMYMRASYGDATIADMLDRTTENPAYVLGYQAAPKLLVETEAAKPLHLHDYDDEPDDHGARTYSPYMCRACETETGDPYAFTRDEQADAAKGYTGPGPVNGGVPEWRHP